MFQNKYEQSQSNQTSSLDIDNTNKTQIPKTLNIVEQSVGKNSYSGTSTSSYYKQKNSYNNLVNKIKLNYRLYHPKQRIQTIILHSNLDKSVNISDSSLIDYYLKNNDTSGNINDNLNTGFALDNSGQYTTNNNKRNTPNLINRTQLEQLVKGHEEEKNNQSMENKKITNIINLTNEFLNKYNKNKNINNNNNNKNVKVNLGNVFNGINDNDDPQKDNIDISQNNNNQDNPNLNPEETDDGTSTNNNSKFPYSSNTYKNNNIISQDLNNIKRKEFNLNNNKTNINDLSTNINSNSTNDDNNFQFGQNKINGEKDMISSFNSGISNQNNYSFPYLKNSCSSLNNNLNGNMNQSLNDNLGTKFTFKQQEDKNNDNQYNLKQYKRNSLPPNYPQNKIIDNNFNEIHDNDNDKIHETNFLSHDGNNKNKIRDIFFNENPNETNNFNNKDNLENNNEEYIEYDDIEDNQQYNNSNNIELTSDRKADNFIPKEKNNYEFNNNNKNKEINEITSLTVTESDEEPENKIYTKKKNNLLKSFLYGLLFGSTVSGIFWLKNESTRKYFLEKMKSVNFSSIFNFLKRLFSNPIKFFKKLFSNERMKDYIKVFGVTLSNFLDIFEKYDDWFRFVGIVLCIYLIWILLKSIIKTFLKLWKENN